MYCIAPGKTAGTYTDTFQLNGASGDSFGPQVTVQIVVLNRDRAVNTARREAVSSTRRTVRPGCGPRFDIDNAGTTCAGPSGERAMPSSGQAVRRVRAKPSTGAPLRRLRLVVHRQSAKRPGRRTYDRKPRPSDLWRAGG